MREYDLGRVFRDQRLNAGLAWTIVAVLGLVAVQQAVTGQYHSALFALTVAVLGTIPAVRFGSLEVTLPWEVLLMASLPTIVRAFATWPVADALATYLAVAAVALIVAIELHAFTPVVMNYWFALLFVVVTTLAAAGGWAVVRYQFDLLLGTEWLLAGQEEVAERTLMFEFVWSAVAGVLAGVIFRAYFQRKAFDGRLPDDVAGEIVDPREGSE
jgi:hypothetical protein